jgi:hypothetical protein
MDAEEERYAAARPQSREDVRVWAQAWQVCARLDLFGVVVLAVVVGLAGGIIRDLLIGVPPATIRDFMSGSPKGSRRAVAPGRVGHRQHHFVAALAQVLGWATHSCTPCSWPR